MRRIAITGGIGSGKSYVCKLLSKHGINIYDCDAGAKRLMNESNALKEALIKLVGTDCYHDGRLNKAVMTAFILASEANKQAVNAIVHPAVIADFYASGLEWMECAILFEAHLEGKVDVVVTVSASEKLRISRIMQRDNLTRERAIEWLQMQMPQQEVEKKSNFIIHNDGQDLDEQIENLLKVLYPSETIQAKKHDA